MKRTNDEVSKHDLNTWAGLRTAPGEQAPKRIDTSMDHTIGAVNKRCEECELVVSEDSLAFCPHCDAGPFHYFCIRAHICPTGTNHHALGGGGPFEIPEFQTSAFQVSQTKPMEESEGHESNNEDEQNPLFSRPSRPNGHSPLKKPEFVNLKEMQKFMATQADQFGGSHIPFSPGVIAANDVIEIPSPILGPSKGPASPEPVAGKLRNTEPMVKPYARGSTALVNDTEADEHAFQKAVKEFEDDKMAASSLGSHNSRVKWWENRATAAGMLSFPLQRSSIRHAGVMLKAGQYRSAAIYLSAMKREHIARGHEWSDSLSQEVKDAIRSCTRGLGPDKRSLAFDLMQVAKIEELKPVAGGPRLPKDTVVLFSLFACREIEAALTRREHVQVESSARGCGVVTLHLPASKTDPKGDGVTRRQGCACSLDLGLCPVAAARRLLAVAENDSGRPDSPFLATEGVGEAPTKAAMVETFRLVAGAVGMSEDQRKALTGHALRATGAQFMARRGIEYYKIQLYCRWGSETILKYLRDAPLEGAEDWVAESVAVEPSVEEVIEQSVHSVASQGGVREETVERLVQQLLETHVSQVFTVIDNQKNDILRIVEELKTKKILIDDHWATELSRRFLPRYVLNLSSNKLHAVKDSLATGCGFDWRGSSDCTLYNNVPTSVQKCEKAGCVKLFNQFDA